ncbi:MAG: DUF6364 family protein [Dehalococcoidia bacterium]
MPENRNLTVRLNAEIIRKARILAAERSTSVSRLVAEQIERLVGKEEAYKAAQREALNALGRGFHLGGGPLPDRGELHDR